CLRKWGYRRCEDICWIKTNRGHRVSGSVASSDNGILTTGQPGPSLPGGKGVSSETINNISAESISMSGVSRRGQQRQLEPGAVFQRTKEHCLMGIKGTVRRSTDGDFIHANIDIDLIIEEGDGSVSGGSDVSGGACGGSGVPDIKARGIAGCGGTGETLGLGGSREKPTEIFHIIEHFCLGRRRLHIFGRDSTLRSVS
ncbi:unnamed protein product, partial [Protopolystoma xenopodis]